jgi:transcriptional regulator with XRE-family HTH domain
MIFSISLLEKAKKYPFTTNGCFKSNQKAIKIQKLNNLSIQNYFYNHDNIGRKEEVYMKETFGKRLTDLRKQRGWTQEEVAKRLNVSAQAVSKWEKDVSLPDIALLSKIAELFETTTDFLLGHARQQVVDVANQSKKEFDKLIFRINILSHEGDKVKVNLPMPLVKVALEIGVTPKVDGKDVLKDIDLNKIMELVEKGVIGKIVEIQTNDGDFVEIVVE